MRASCETDVARQFPLAVVAKWLGNTQAVVMRHYVDVTDADFERAVMMEAAQNPAQQAHAKGRSEPQPATPAHEKSPGFAGERIVMRSPAKRGSGGGGN